MRTLKHANGLIQRVAVADLTGDGPSIFTGAVQAAGGRVNVLYSDPPWSPGNEKYWRRHAKAEPPGNYGSLLRGWCACAIAGGPKHILCEQSIIASHRNMLLRFIDELESWELPLLEQWGCMYGSPKRPNVLLHWGTIPLATDPTGLSANTMTKTVFQGLELKPCGVVADPCTGLGMTSRMAHRFNQHFVGTELNAARLERTVGWLLSHGYTEVR